MNWFGAMLEGRKTLARFAYRVQVVDKEHGWVISQQPGTTKVLADELKVMLDRHMEAGHFTRVVQIQLVEVENFPKQCSCCPRVIQTLADWYELKRIGEYADDVETLEHRNCTCGTTLSIVTDKVLPQQ